MAREGVIITIGGRIQGALNALQTVSKSIAGLGAQFLAVAGFAGVAATAFTLAGTALREAMDMEQSLASLETLTGDLDVARHKMEQLVAFAQRSPLDLKGVQDTARLLLATGTSADALMGRIEMLGDIAAGAKQPVNELGLVFSQVMNKGRLMAQDLNQFSERGVPLLQELASIYKVSAREILKMGEAGQISSEMVEYALRKMTAEGGRFYQAMEKQNQTFAGKLNSLKEIWLERLRDFGTPITDALKPILDQVSNFLKESKGIFVTMGSKIAEWITAAGEKIKEITASMPMFWWKFDLFTTQFAITGNQFLLKVGTAAKVLAGAGVTFFSYIKAAMAALMATVTEWSKRGGGITSILPAIKAGLDALTQGMQSVNDSLAKNPLIEAMTKFNTGLADNVKSLEGVIEMLMGNMPKAPTMSLGASVGKGVKPLGAPPGDMPVVPVFNDKELERLKKQAEGLGQSSGTAATARQALQRAQREAEHRQRGNIEEADRQARLARESQRLANDQEARRKQRADRDSRNKLTKDKFDTEAPTSKFDPRTGRPLPEVKDTKPQPKPDETTNGWLSKIEGILDKRLPAETAA